MWNNVLLQDCCEILDNKRIPLNDEQRYNIQGNIPYYGANGIQGFINDYIFDEPLILLAEDGGYFEEFERRPIAYLIKGKSWVNNHAHVLKAKEEFVQNYIFYSLVHKNILPFIKGGTRSKLNQSELKTIHIFAPVDPKEQQKIATILETIDVAIEKTEEHINKYEQIKQGLTHDLFTRGVDKNGKLRPTYEEAPELYKESELGMIPKEWRITNLLNTAYLKGRIGWQGLRADEFIEYGAYLVTGTDFEDGKINWLHCYHVSDRRFKEAFYIQLKNNDVLITKDGSIGKLAFVEDCPKEAVLNSGIFLIRCKTGEYHNKFLYYVLNSLYFDNFLVKYQGGSTISHLYQREFEKFQFPVPNITEQEVIISMIDNIVENIEVEKSNLNKLKNKKRGLMQDLLTGTVRVKNV